MTRWLAFLGLGFHTRELGIVAATQHWKPETLITMPVSYFYNIITSGDVINVTN